MKAVYNLATMPDLHRPIAFAVGTFDGVHLGHRFLIETMKRYGTTVIFTFPNHPREVLNPEIKVPRLSSENYKLKLLEEAGVDLCLLQSFSKDMAGMTYNHFLEEIYTVFPFDHLFFGENDTIGKGREGTKENIEKLGKELGFSAHYLPKFTIDNEAVSSSTIRKFIADGDFKRAEKLLGRKFAVYSTIECASIDSTLIKPGPYKFQLCSSSRTLDVTGRVDQEGSILFDAPPPIGPGEAVTIIFIKD